MNSYLDSFGPKKPPKKVNHTPGPWSPDPTPAATAGAEWLILGPPDKKGKHLGICCVWKTSDSITHMARDEVGAANARLIAAAPDLLEACERLLAKFENDVLPGESGWDDVEFARAVIAKSKEA